MTEEEAKAKACCGPKVLTAAIMSEVLVAVDVDAREKVLTGTMTCLGSECMAWRWIRLGPPDPGLPIGGYCGLAGKP